MTDGSTRDRLLAAAGELLTESPDVSTRAICDRAGVQAPTLYHYFGNKQGLLAAVVETRFTEHLRSVPAGDDPVTTLRANWDHHVRFGLANPNYYALTSTLMPVAQKLLSELLNEIARHGRLRTAPDVAARQLVAANVGATVSLLAGDQDAGWSDQRGRHRRRPAPGRRRPVHDGGRFPRRARRRTGRVHRGRAGAAA
jgi:AcrR family transcriptional regulator